MKVPKCLGYFCKKILSPRPLKISPIWSQCEQDIIIIYNSSRVILIYSVSCVGTMLEADVEHNLAYWSYAEIKHSDWVLKVTWLVLTNQTALFQHSIATVLETFFMKSTLSCVLIYDCRVFIRLAIVTSVTRWLNYLFNIWPSRTMKICPIVKIFAKVGSQFGQILNNFSRNGRILF